MPEHINRPSYFDTSVPPPGPDEPEIKTAAQIQKMRESCKLARFILNSVGKYIKVRPTEMQNEYFTITDILKLKCYFTHIGGLYYRRD